MSQNPLLEPIHGVSLEDYAVVSAKIVAGIDKDALIEALGIEKAIFEEASALWVARMQEDSTFEIMTAYGQYFANADEHPKIGHIKVEISQKGQENLERFKTDRYFYEELNAARQAAYAYGLDGAQWILDNYGINLADFQSVEAHWVQDIQNEDYETIRKFLDYREEKVKTYEQKFAEEQGGNIGDDIDF